MHAEHLRAALVLLRYLRLTYARLQNRYIGQEGLIKIARFIMGMIKTNISIKFMGPKPPKKVDNRMVQLKHLKRFIILAVVLGIGSLLLMRRRLPTQFRGQDSLELTRHYNSIKAEDINSRAIELYIDDQKFERDDSDKICDVGQYGI